MSVELENSILFFSRIGGFGILECKICGHSEKVLSFTHGIYHSTTGYQCQDCGQFSTRFVSGRDGILECKACGHSEEVHGYRDSIVINPPQRQCKKCGEYKTMFIEQKKSGDLRCECGGKLSREEVIFCTNCRSENVSYTMSKIT